MANRGEENIHKANRERTSEEHRRNARKAGIASGVARREKKTLRAQLLTLLDTTHITSKGEEKTLRELAALALIKRAMQGDPSAFKTIRETIGEDVPKQVEIESRSKVKISFGNMTPEQFAICLADIKEQEQRGQEDE
jgi:hypothetical protein